MKIYDISQELTECNVYPGDPAPRLKHVSKMEDGALYNLSTLEMCVHNGTHVDAPLHFIKDGGCVEKIPLEKCVGRCAVIEYNGKITAENAREMVEKVSEEAKKRIIIKGDGVITVEAAKTLEGLFLIGTESQSVGDVNAPMAVHKQFLSNETVLLEGLKLDGVKAGEYLLCAAPINIKNSDGAPVRAILIDIEDK